MLKRIAVSLRWCAFLLFLALAVGAGIAYRRVDSELRDVVRAALRNKFPGTQTTFESVRLDGTRGVRLRSVAWRKAGASKAAPALLTAEELYVECPIDWKSVAARRFKPVKITITRPQLRVGVDFARIAEDVAALRPRPDDSPCPVEIFDAAVAFVDESSPNAESIRDADGAVGVPGATTFAGLRVLLTPTPRSTFGGLPRLGARIDANAPNRSNAPIDSGDSTDEGGAEQSNENAPNAPTNVDAANDADVESLPPDETVWTLDLRAATPYVEELRVRGFAADGAWALQGSARGLDLAPLLALFGANAKGKLGPFAKLQGHTSLDFELTRDANAPNGVRFRVDGDLERGAVVLPTLRYPLSDVEIRYSASDSELTLRRATARCGLATATAVYRQTGPLAAPVDAALRLRLNDFPLDDATLRKLATENANAVGDSKEIDAFLNILDDYCFSATANVDLALERSARTANRWAPTNVVVDGTNVDLTCAAFPYRLERLAGRLTLDRAGALTLSLDSASDDRAIKIAARFDDALGSPRGGVSIEGVGFPIDAKLTAALPESSRVELARLRPTGTIDARIGLTYNPALAEPFDFRAKIGVRDGSLRYDAFPLPISSVVGTIETQDGAWVFSDFFGKSGAARVRASGSLVSGKALADAARNSATTPEQTLKPTPRTFAEPSAPAPVGATFAEFDDDSNADSPAAPTVQAPPTDERFASALSTEPNEARLPADAWRFRLTADVESFPLGEELSNALVRYDGRAEIDRLGLEGRANGRIVVEYRTDANRLGLAFDASPVPGSAAFQPASFPLKLTDLEGRVSYREGALTVDGFRAKSGETTVEANARGRFSPASGWVVDVPNFRIERFQLDRELQSVAESATTIADFLRPTGLFNADGAFRIERAAAPDSPRRVAWDVRLVAQQNAARPGIAVENVCGRVRLRGVGVERGPVALAGEFDLDSFCVGDVQVSDLLGPFYFDGTDFYWGRAAPPIRRTPLYRDSFLRPRIDADPAYRTVVPPTTAGRRPNFYRGQAPTDRSNVATGIGPGTGPGPGTGTGNAEVVESAPGFASSDSATQTFRVDPSGKTALDDAARQNERLAEIERKATAQNRAAATGNANANDGGIVEADPDSRPIQARVFGGASTTDGVFRGGAVPTYRFDVKLQDAGLDEVSREFAPGSKPLQGRVAAFATLQGEGRNVATLKGEGGLGVRNAALYELPQIVKIFQMLSVREPDQTAFDSAFVDFEVIGDRLKLNRVLLEGNALTLFGDGWLTIREQEKLIDLTLNSRLGNASSQIPIVSDVIGGAGDQLAQIRVEGKIDSPVIRQERFPGVKKAWWSVFPEQEPTPTDKAPTSKPRPVLDALKKLTGGDK